LILLRAVTGARIMEEGTYQFYQFSNGIRVVHLEKKSIVGHLGVIINAGSRDELEYEQGMAHFIEHSIFKGTRKRRAFHILSRIEDVGGELNAYTTKEETAIYASFLTEYYPRASELLSDIFFNSMFPAKELEREKEVVMEEINSFKDSPAELIFDEFDELIFDGHPLARNILGTPETLRTFDREKILSFIGRNYHTDQVVISSVGAVPFPKLIAMLEKFFGSATPNLRTIARDPFKHYTPREKQLHKDTHQAHCVLGNIAYDNHHRHRVAMILLSNLIGGQGLNSRLNLALRERRGMAYNVEAGYTSFTDTGIFNVYFGTDKENLNKALKIVNNEFQSLRDSQLGNLQLSKAKKQLIGQMAIAADNHEELMLTLGRSYLFFEKVDPMSRVFEKIEAVTASEILEVANTILDTGQLSRLIFC